MYPMFSDKHKAYELINLLINESTYNNNTTTKLRSTLISQIHNEYAVSNNISDLVGMNKYFTDREVLEHFAGSEPLERYANSIIGHHISSGSIDKDIKSTINSFNAAKHEKDDNQINTLKKAIIALGWNPYVEYTPENIEKGQARVQSIFQRELNECYFIDCRLEARAYQAEEGAVYSEIRPTYVVVECVDTKDGYIYETYYGNSIDAILNKFANKFQGNTNVYEFYTQHPSNCAITESELTTVHISDKLNELGLAASEYKIPMELMAARAIKEFVGNAWNPGERMIVKLVGSTDGLSNREDRWNMINTCTRFDNYCNHQGIGIGFDQNSPFMPSRNYTSMNPMILHNPNGELINKAYTTNVISGGSH